jgi:hypothetical protein
MRILSVASLLAFAAANLHGLAMRGLPLGVACTTCGHRALLDGAKVGARDGNMTEIHQLKLRCTECDGRLQGHDFQRAEPGRRFPGRGFEGRWPAGVLSSCRPASVSHTLCTLNRTTPCSGLKSSFLA